MELLGAVQLAPKTERIISRIERYVMGILPGASVRTLREAETQTLVFEYDGNVASIVFAQVQPRTDAGPPFLDPGSRTLTARCPPSQAAGHTSPIYSANWKHYVGVAWAAIYQLKPIAGEELPLP